MKKRGVGLSRIEAITVAERDEIKYKIVFSFRRECCECKRQIGDVVFTKDVTIKTGENLGSIYTILNKFKEEFWYDREN